MFPHLQSNELAKDRQGYLVWFKETSMRITNTFPPHSLAYHHIIRIVALGRQHPTVCPFYSSSAAWRDRFKCFYRFGGGMRGVGAYEIGINKRERNDKEQARPALYHFSNSRCSNSAICKKRTGHPPSKGQFFLQLQFSCE